MKMHHSSRRTSHKISRARYSCFLLLALALSTGVSLAHADNASCPKQPCPQKRNPPAKPQPRVAPIANAQVSHAPVTNYSTPPPHALIKEKIPTVGPGSPGPMHSATTAPTTSSAASKQGIIFVGGKNALNPQPIPPGHSAITPSVSPAPKFNTPAPKPVPKTDPISH